MQIPPAPVASMGHANLARVARSQRFVIIMFFFITAGTRRTVHSLPDTRVVRVATMGITR